MGQVLRVATRAIAVLALLAVAYVGVTAAQVWRASRADQAQRAEAIVVLGAAQYDGDPSPVLRGRLDHAAELFQTGIAPVVVVTGGQQPGDRFTEASAAAGYLHERGVPEQALRRETTSRTSWESLAATARILRQEGIGDEVVLVSDPYHSFRIAQIAGEVGLDASVSPTSTASRNLAVLGRSLARETAAVSLGRILGYRRLVGLQERLDPLAG
jgi:uncharacterized SAM-binding protein YcdF (DUF218 family)